MLAEIYCEQFCQKRIEFTKSLNVILGTDTGDNSIGKSTFMLIVDFAFGGSAYSKATDILENIGSHDIYFKFIFSEKEYYFCRNNMESNTVWVCESNQKKHKSISLQEYCNWLSGQYNLDFPYLSFRDTVGRYIRAYGKGNCDEKHPLHYFSSESGNKAIMALLKLFNRYGIIANIEKQSELSKEELRIFNKAQSLNYVAKIGKRDYRKNIDDIKQYEKEIQEISADMEQGLLDIDVVTSKRAIYIKSELSKAKRMRGNLYSKLNTMDENGKYKFSGTSESYNELKKYFPQIDLRHIGEIESFHKKVSTIFKNELNAGRRKILSAIKEYDLIISDYEVQLKELIQNPKLSKMVLQRHAEVLQKIEKMRVENEAYEKLEELKIQKKKDEERLVKVKNEQLGIIENLINTEMKKINDLLYEEKYNSPLIHFTDTGYTFNTPNDTGTGIAYKGLVVFDMAILHLTQLPIVVHDSVVLKQISDDAIENIMNQYIGCEKQIIIALDKQQSYTAKTSELLEKYSVLKLAPNGRELFGRSWGKSSK